MFLKELYYYIFNKPKPLNVGLLKQMRKNWKIVIDPADPLKFVPLYNGLPMEYLISDSLEMAIKSIAYAEFFYESELELNYFEHFKNKFNSFCTVKELIIERLERKRKVTKNRLLNKQIQIWPF
jgi:hypothetical protein